MDKQTRWAQEKAFEERIRNYAEERRKEADPLGLIVTVVLTATIAIVLLFLSSAAFGAANVKDRNGINLHSARVDGLRLSGGLYGALDFRLVPKDDWAKPKAPLRFIYAWPHLPSIEEVRIKVAAVRLTDTFRAHTEAHRKKVEAIELALDWDAGKKALALAFLSSGVILTAVSFLSMRPVKRKRI